eukprot:2038472-Amphidinium_carterae.3
MQFKHAVQITTASTTTSSWWMTASFAHSRHRVGEEWWEGRSGEGGFNSLMAQRIVSQCQVAQAAHPLEFTKCVDPHGTCHSSTSTAPPTEAWNRSTGPILHVDGRVLTIAVDIDLAAVSTLGLAAPVIYLVFAP